MSLFKNTAKKHKLSFISAILIVIGSSIGAGIFLKNDEVLKNTQGNIWFALIAWAIAIFAIVCLGLCLMELCSPSQKNKLGIIGWVKTFCNEYLYQSSKKFMAYIYLPINFFIMPLYAVMTLQEAFPNSVFATLPSWAVMLIGFAFTSWFVLTSGMSSKMTNIQNIVITSFKFIPLIFAAIVGYAFVANTGDIKPFVPNMNTDIPMFNELSPVLGIFISVPSIFFVFDGFYSTAGLQTEMSEPKKTSKAMLFGLLTVSCIDILISISLMISGKGSLAGLREWLDDHRCLWLLQTMQVFIAFGIFGIINGFSLYSSNFYEDLISRNDCFLSNKLKNKVSPNSHLVGCIYGYCLFTICFFAASCIGSYGYMDTNNYLGADMGYDSYTAQLYSFVDLLANWTSALVFAWIVASIIGALVNRKTKHIKTADDKNFVWASIITIVIVVFSLIMILVETFANLGMVWWYWATHSITDDIKSHVVGVTTTAALLILFVLVMFIPINNKKYNTK